MAAGYLLAACALYVTHMAATVKGCMAGLSGTAFLLYGGFGPVWAIALDPAPGGSRGTFSGFCNYGGQIGGFFAPIVAGALVNATASFTEGFLFMIASLVIAAAGCASVHPTLRRQELPTP